MKSFKWFILVILFTINSSVFAQILASLEQQKIEFLKSELLSSNCLFERNGKQYNAKKAVKHINRKQDHFEDEIDSTDKFIALTATQSSMSGKPYFIICGDDKTESAVWLKNKLSLKHWKK